MLNPLQKIMVAREERELLYTLSLYKILQDRKQTVVVEKEATWHDVSAAYMRMIYAAYLNAIEVRQIDEPDYNPERLKYMDFVIWGEERPQEFAVQFKVCYEFITGKPLEVDGGSEKKKKNNSKKMSILNWIGLGKSNRS